MRSLSKWIGTLLASLLLAACGDGGGGGVGAGATGSFCDSRLFTAPEDSPFILPYPTGVTYVMSQGNCSLSPGGHQQTFAYDMEFGMGDPIYAARGGRVIFVNDQFADTDNVEGHENNVFIEHVDGTVARYTHLMQGSAVMTVGELAVAGSLVGAAGNSGNSSGPHLHFQVFAGRNYSANNALPITFNNAIGTLGPNGELLEGEAYTAGPVAWGYLEPY
jgi:murein DD-endopeptidase MepM/ murein hydrolase activator NlpD